MLEAVHWTEAPEPWPWPNFSPRELACRHCGALRLDEDAVDRLQWVRGRLGRPMYINSAYRCPIWNAMVGGAPLSRHKAGDAFDVSLRGLLPHELLELARRARFRGFGFYRTFLHVDLGRSRHWYGKGGKETWSS